MLVVERVSAWLSVAFGGAALLLTSLGLYGLIAYVVHTRTTEIGIRIALGATRSGILFLVLYDALVVVLIGIVIGVVTAWGASLILVSKYAIVNHELSIGMFGASILLILTTVTAAYLPALRAYRSGQRAP